MKQIAHLKAILADPDLVFAIIKEELLKVKAEFADKRRTQIVEGDIDIDDESLIPEEESVFLFTSHGYLKRMPLGTWREQNRGGKGLRGLKTKEEDTVVESTVGSTHDWLCFFTNQGRVYWLKGYKVPTGTRAHKGKPVVNLLNLEPNELVETIIPVRDFGEPVEEVGEDAPATPATGAADGTPPAPAAPATTTTTPQPTLFFATKKGTVKRTLLSAFRNVREKGIIAINLDEGDELLAVRKTDGNADIILATKDGQACRFDEAEVRVMGRGTTGVRGINLEEGDEVVSLAIAEPGTFLVSVTEHGYGKRTELEEYRKTRRGAKGVRTIVVNDRNGHVIAVRTVHGDESLLLLSQAGMGVRIPVDQMRAMGRSTQGVTLMDLDEGDRITQVAVLPAEGEVATEPALTT